MNLILSPLLWRDLRLFLRTWKSFIALLFFLMFLELLVGLYWSNIIESWDINGDNSNSTRALYYSLVRGHLLFLMFFTPFLTATAFFSEREQGTFELLFSSPISNTHIVLAKLLASLGFVIILLIAGSPILVLCVVGGGISFFDIAGAYGLFLCSILVYGSLGLFCATFFSKAYQTMLATALMTFVVTIIIPFHQTVLSYIDPRFMSYLNRMINPIDQIQRLLTEQRIGSGGFTALFETTNHGMEFINPLYIQYFLIYPNPFNSFAIFSFYGLCSIFLCLIFLLGTLIRTRILSQDFSRKTPGKRKDYNINNKNTNILLHDITGETDSMLSPAYLSASELLEKRGNWFARSGSLIRIGYVTVIASLLILPIASSDSSLFFFLLPLFMTLLITLPITATRFGMEREQGTFDLLRTTLMPMRDYIDSKFKTCRKYSIIFALALYIPGMLSRFIYGWRGNNKYFILDVIILFGYPLFLYVCINFYTALALFGSARFKKTNNALLAIGLIILLTMITPLYFITYNVVSPLIKTPPSNDAMVNGVFFIENLGAYASIIVNWLRIKGCMLLSPLISILSVLSKGQIRLLIHDTGRLGFPFNTVPKGTLPVGAYFFVISQCFIFLGLTSLLKRWTVKIMDKVK